MYSLQVDEVQTLTKKNDPLKNAITNSTINVEHKGKDVITVANLCNFLFTTNNEDCFHVTGDDRRMCMFRCNAKFKGNGEYFERLGRHLADEDTAIAFFHFLKQRDLSRYVHDFESSKPVTTFYEEIRILCIVIEKRFLSGLVNQREDVITVSLPALFGQFCAWSETEKYRFTRTSNRFNMIVMRVRGIRTERRGNIMWYEINCPVVRADLISSREFDPYATVQDFN